MAIEDGVAANLCVSVSWMNCENPFPQNLHLMSFVPVLLGLNTVNFLMIAIVNKSLIAIEDGVAANVCVSVSWMNCETPFSTEPALDVLCACVTWSRSNHPKCSNNILQLFHCQRPSTSTNDRLLINCANSLFTASLTELSENIVMSSSYWNQ
eukprot:3205041-Amphidinium_carterae.1